VLFSNHIIFVTLEADVGSTDYLNYLPIHKTHQNVSKCNPFSKANQSIKQPTNQPTKQPKSKEPFQFGKKVLRFSLQTRPVSLSVGYDCPVV
jgi:hypothetical protein